MDGNYSDSVPGDYHLASLEDRLRGGAGGSGSSSTMVNKCDNCKIDDCKQHSMQGVTCGICQVGSCQRSCASSSTSRPHLEKRCSCGTDIHCHSSRRVFGVELSQQIVAEALAPPLLVRCVEEIEKRTTHLDLNGVYGLTAPPDAMKTLAGQISSTGDLDILAACEIACVVELMKRYLLELPSPVIASSMYDMFIEAIVDTDTDEQRDGLVLDLTKKLPDAHLKTLRFLMSHFCRLSCAIARSGRSFCPVTLLQPLAICLIRPQWSKSELIPKHVVCYNKVLDILLLKGDWGVDMSGINFAPASTRVSPYTVDFTRRNSFSTRGLASPKSLDECEWYWGDISRDDAKAALKDQPDGTFLVRMASSRVTGEFTLTIRKDGSDRLVRIMSRDGKFGFAEPLEFDSLQAVIDYHRTNTLLPYNRQLDICLFSPLARSRAVVDSGDKEKMLQQLRENSTEYIMWSEIHERLSEDSMRGNQEVAMKKQAMEAFDAAVRMFEEQIRILECFQREAKPNEVEAVKTNYALLKTRHDGIISSRAKLQVDLNQQTQWLRNKEQELSNIQQRITHLNIVRDDFIKVLSRSGVAYQDLEVILKESAKVGAQKGNLKFQTKDFLLSDIIQEEMAAMSPTTNTPVSSQSRTPVLTPRSVSLSRSQPTASPVHVHPPPTTPVTAEVDDSMWYLESVDRLQADAALVGKRVGTFLIRRRIQGNNGATHALSVVVAEGKVGHCLINQNEKGFGFAQPSADYPTLRALVQHYSKVSLVEHNPNLNVCLLHPVHVV